MTRFFVEKERISEKEIIIDGADAHHIARSLRMAEGDEPVITEMKMNVIYDVLPGEWHHITVSPDATVLIVENADTSAANSDKYAVDGGERV